jgi:hypothetical protein
MTRRCFAVTLSAVALVAFAPVPAAAQADAPRTSWGQPDLQGVWDFRTITPMERPADLAEKEFLTDEEAAELEQVRAAANAARDGEVPADIVGNYNTFWFDRGDSVIGTRRTSLVTDPPDGRIPPLTPEAERKRAATAQTRQDTGPHEPSPGGWVDDLGPNGLQVRCITGFNSGPPMTPGGYNNNVQLFQTPDTVVLLSEMNHNVRVVPLDGRAHVDLRQWTGDARGHWEGDTLVVESLNFFRETSFMRGGASADLQLTERFTRVSPDVLLYQVTIDDPTTWTRPWTYEVPMQRNTEPVYEYACHEGNYAMEVILAGARAKEAEAENQQ